MKKIRLRARKQTIIISMLLLSILSLFLLQVNLKNENNKFNGFNIEEISNNIKNENSPQYSAVWATINITNYQLNQTQHHHNETITIEGNLKYNNGSDVKNEEVGIFVDDVYYSQFIDTTNNTGNFEIDFIVPTNLPIYYLTWGYKIQVNVTDENKGKVIKENYLIIYLVPYAKLNLTNSAINNTHYYRGSTVPIEGRLYEYTNPPNGLSGYHVSLFVNGKLNSRFNATTGSNGTFQINCWIPFNLDLYQSYKIEVNVTQGILINEVELQNYFIIYAKATSIFEINNLDSFLKIPGEFFSVRGYLRYDSVNGSGIPNALIISNWFNTSYTWSTSYSFSTLSDGSFSANIQIPYDAYSHRINLNLSYSGDVPYVENSEIVMPKIILFSDVVWQNMEIQSQAYERENITISGQIVSRDNESLKLYNRTVVISYEGTQVDVVETNSDGYFTINYTIPFGAGNRTIRISLVNTAGLDISIERNINVTAATTYVPSPPTEFPPYFLFSLIFFPILAVIVSGLIVYGIRYYKKQEKESRVVNLPLESKLINLKILKDTGRLEESLSYLFNAIFMDLINAKYGRTRKVTETIRDFAIISVKELKLTPATVYPFIQKIEEIIYARPYRISNKDFYETCGLFSPIYFQLTGYNFELNF